MKIFDNIGCEFAYNFTDNSFVLLGSLPGYSSLSIEDAGFSIPYLARNIDGKNIDYELGVGYLDKINNKLIVKDKKISVSSNNNQYVDFTKKGNKQFYIFVHNVNFDNAFNNVFIKNTDFNIESRKSIYIVDVSSGYIIGSLPDPQKCEAVELEFKILGNGSLKLNYQNFNIILNENSYTKLVSTGQEWVELKDSSSSISSLSLSDENSFKLLSDPSGEDRSLQFKNGGLFDGSSLYQGNNNKLLFGSSTENLAKHIIPSSGNYNTVFNQTKDNSNFIVYGEANTPGYPEKNLYFSYDGKLGINMPSGINTSGIVKPSTILHIFNTLCREGIRLENRANCYPADITLYDNPFTFPRPDGSGIARIVFAGKDSSSNKVDFAKIETSVKSSASKQGQLSISVSDGSNTKTTLSSSANKTVIKTDSALVDLDTNNINISGSSVGINANNVNLGTNAFSNINISGTTTLNNKLRLPSINTANALLSINSNYEVIATTGFKIPSLSTSQDSLLTAKADGTVSATIPKDSLWPYETGQKIGGKDLIWDRYPYRSGEVCLNKATKEIQIEPTPLEEFSVNDQIAILNLADYNTYYRYISSMVVTGDTITGLFLDQNLLITGSNPNLRIYSVSKGGVLSNKIYTSGIISDATDVVLSSRPGVDTVFNSLNKNIGFKVYGSENTATLNVIASASVGNSLVGNYFKYATSSNIAPLQTKINSVGAGSANNSVNNTVNFNNAAGDTWLSKISIVGNNGTSSYYGTFDQNGNVYEWIEDDNKLASYSSYQYICGGSWRTFDNNALRGYISTPRSSGLDDVGFRICSKAGYTNSDVENRLSLSFARVDNVNNPADTTPIYTESWTNRFDDTNDQPVPVSKTNLGSVSYPYRIGQFEITNSQYALFLNSVATGLSSISGLYKPNMTNSAIGGINISGSGTITSPYVYSVKSNMGNTPVVFVDYLSSIRFINWLSNGAPTGVDVNNSTTEIGAYIIEGGPGGVDQVSKNRDQNYWLPTLNEWHKAAYYKPSDSIESTELSAVTIRRETPFEYSASEPFVSGTGSVASLTINGLTYSDQIKINEFNIVDTDNKNYSSVINSKEAILSVSGVTSFINRSGLIDDEEAPIGRVFLTPEKTVFGQSILITTGNFSSINNSAGLLLSPSGLNYLDEAGVPVSGGLFPGPAGGYLCKSPDEGSLIISSSGNLVAKIIESGLYASLNNTNMYEIIHNNFNSALSSSPWFTVGKPFDALDVETNEIVAIRSTGVSTTISANDLGPVLYTDRIVIGPVLNTFAGSLLTHDGNKAAYWQENTFLNAPGASWQRYPKRTIEFGTIGGEIRLLKFINLDTSKGGTGSVSSTDIRTEFNFNETIAVYNLNREVFYVKVANIGLLDSRDAELNQSFFVSEGDLVISVCPPIPASFIQDSQLNNLPESDPDFGRTVGYAFSVQKGAYLNMDIEPTAVQSFNCSILNPDNSEYRFKPSTANTLSIRPNIHTAFNKRAENIDFVVYGHRKTLFTRYEPEWFNQDVHGVPTGIEPAFRIHSKVDNSYLGSIESGVIYDTIGETDSVATGVYPDLKPKITINTNEPYSISSLVGITRGVLLPAATESANLQREKTYGTIIPSTGVMLTGIKNISTYADVTIKGSTYTDSLITKDVVLGPLWTGEIPVPYELSLTQKIYAPNYPLTVNRLGQIVSLIPPPAPEAPSSPRNLFAEAKNNSIVLTWDEPQDDGGEPVVGYIIELSVDGGVTWNDSIAQDIDSLTKLPVIADKNTIRILNNPDVINNTSYSFRVKAYNIVGLGSLSDSISATPMESIGPAAPRNFVISSGENSSDIRNSNNITLTWSAPSVAPNPDEYVVQYWVYNTLNNTDLKNATWISANSSPVSSLTNQIQITGLDTKPLIYFSVQSKQSNGSLSARNIYASLGTDPDPRPIGSRPQTIDTNQYNFGSVIFLGSCS